MIKRELVRRDALAFKCNINVKMSKHGLFSEHLQRHLTSNTMVLDGNQFISLKNI